jgi:hypothetical protein
VVAALTLGTALAGCRPPAAPPTDASAASSPAAHLSAGSGAPAGRGPTAAATAVAALAALRVKGRAPKSGYRRDLFGPRWADVDRNGCDTRSDILGRDLTRRTIRPGTHGCVVLTGTLADPYTGRTITFVAGPGTSDGVQIDHVVALSDAWQKGAQSWSAATRLAFANDPLNLLAVSGSSNVAKGDGDAATWLPPNRAYRCAYAARQVAVKAKYHAWVTAAEHDALARVLTGCRALRVPTGGLTLAAPGGSSPVSDAAAQPGPAPAGRPAAAPAARPTSTKAGSATGPYFATCAAARAAGAAPLGAGEPGYRLTLDRDRDGVACE